MISESNSKQQSESGFTPIELMIVIAIIGILAAIANPLTVLSLFVTANFF